MPGRWNMARLLHAFRNYLVRISLILGAMLGCFVVFLPRVGNLIIIRCGRTKSFVQLLGAGV